MSEINTLNELLTRLEKALDSAKVDPQAFLDDHEAMTKIVADWDEKDLMINELNSRLQLISTDIVLAANCLVAAATARGLVPDEKLLNLISMLPILPRPYKGNHD
ncbi:MAG: hypothetical protein ABR999_10750 [Methanoregula sp.]|jgi:hypothetical protein|uniref:hypothetical protein n=1 Tax=Methanoregula sp. TaxID=2052170 RepID=UPI003D11442B